MRTVPVLLAALLPLTLSVPAAEGQTTFEGVISYEITSAGQSMQVRQLAKGMKIRQELEGPMGQMISLVDAEEGTMTTIMPSQKMYMTMDMKAMMQQVPQSQRPEPEPDDFQATGKKETIAGHACEHYRYEGEGTTVEMCIATGLGFLPFSSPGAMNRGGGMPGMDKMEAWQERFPDGLVPLSMELTSQGQTMTMRATSVERKSLAADLFEVPAGYTKMPGPGSGN